MGARIIGWCATLGVARGEKEATSECSVTVRARNHVALTAVPKTVMHARGIPPLVPIAVSVGSSPLPLIEQECVLDRVHHQCLQLLSRCQLQLRCQLHHRRIVKMLKTAIIVIMSCSRAGVETSARTVF